MIEVGTLCLTALVIAWLGRGAHDLRLRDRASERGERMKLLKAAEVGDVEQRVGALEKRVERVESDVLANKNAMALRGVGRR